MAAKQHAEHFPSESSPIISKASCDLLRAFQVCVKVLPTAGKSLLPAVIKTDNLTGEKVGGGARGNRDVGGGEKREPKKEIVGGFREARAQAESLPLEMCCGSEGVSGQQAVKNAAFLRQVNGISLVIMSSNNGHPCLFPLSPFYC